MEKMKKINKKYELKKCIEFLQKNNFIQNDLIFRKEEVKIDLFNDYILIYKADNNTPYKISFSLKNMKAWLIFKHII